MKAICRVRRWRDGHSTLRCRFWWMGVLLLAAACAAGGGDGLDAAGESRDAGASPVSGLGRPPASAVEESAPGGTGPGTGAPDSRVSVSGGSVAVWDAESVGPKSAVQFGAGEHVATSVSGWDRSGCVGLGDAHGLLLPVIGGGECPQRTSAADDSEVSDSGERSAGSAEDSSGVMALRRAVAVSGCAAPFHSPGEQVSLVAGGFAAAAMVSMTGHAASLGDARLTAPALADATADADGVIEVSWSVPSAPGPPVDAAPRGYAVVASGANPVGGTHTARLLIPVIVYPGTVPCAVPDAAATSLGAVVQIDVLGNDIAPTGGSLDAVSVAVRPAAGGAFEVDEATGAVTFTPEPGFWGTVSTSYVVYDNWGIGVEAALSVTVDAGCTVTGTVDVVLMEGTEGNDVLCVPDRDDHRAFHIMDGKGGDDVILGGAGEEWIYGGDGADVIYGNGGDDQIVAGAGVDTVHGGSGTDSVYSIDTADTIVDDDFELVLSPVATVEQSGPVVRDDWAWVDVSETVAIDVLANDHDSNEDLDPAALRVTAAPTLGSAAVSETADGRTVISYSSPVEGGTVSFSYEVCDALGSCAEADVTVMVGTAGCTIVGTGGDDRLRGTSGDDVICGLDGNDIIHGMGGDDVIVGGAGHDLVYGGDPAADGDDGDDVIWGGAGDDTLLGGAGDDRLWGGAGDDSLYGEAGGDELHGGPGADRVSGGAGDDRLWGGAGDDRLWGFEGADWVWGGPGDDVLLGSPGADVLWGGVGGDVLNGGPGADRLHGGAGSDELFGYAGNDALWGGPGNDEIWGHDGADELHGGPGADVLDGGIGDDALWGGIDADTLDGGYGTDHLDGGPDTDSCARASTTSGCE